MTTENIKLVTNFIIVSVGSLHTELSCKFRSWNAVTTITFNERKRNSPVTDAAIVAV